jgi:two-component system, NtrC family, C4-dicarboxylate transport response regulator DctD
MSLLARHVVVVDDNHDILAVTKKMLENKGYLVHDFTEPVKALAHAKDCKECGVVITDLRMPKMNGLQLIRELKESRPDMKAVLMTATEIKKEEWQQTLPSAKVDQFLTKPFNSVNLVEAIEKCLLLVH